MTGAQGNDIVPIPGTKRRCYLEENISARDVDLTEEDLIAIEKIFQTDLVVGDRYDERGMQSVNH